MQNEVRILCFSVPLSIRAAATTTISPKFHEVYRQSTRFYYKERHVMPFEMGGPSSEAGALALSKNQQKKLKRDQEWEAGRDARKARRKEKIKQKKLQKRMTRGEASQTAPPSHINSTDASQTPREIDSVSRKPKARQSVQLPITFIIDCGFDDLMNDKERKSLASQVTRSYSDNHKAAYQPHLAISSFGGHLKERFESVLSGNYHSWKNIQFVEKDFVQAAEQAKTLMQGQQGGKMAGAFKRVNAVQPIYQQSYQDSAIQGEVVYLSSDSPDTLTELRPYSSYIIGGLVDRNRHKGVGYKRAMDKGIKTAKLPIGDYMQMTSRFVLATNHVAEIMLRWLELGDWGKAFLQVIPKRKRGTLKNAPQSDSINESLTEGDKIDTDAAVGATSHEASSLEEARQVEEDNDDEDDDENVDDGGGVSLDLKSKTIDDSGVMTQSSMREIK